MFVEAVLWIVRTALSWRDLPDVFGSWNSAFRRFSRWSAKGVWRHPHDGAGACCPVGYCESFNSKLRDELLNGEIFSSLAETRVVIECWRQHYNTVRPHSSMGYNPPAPEVQLRRGPPTGAAPPAAPTVAPRPTVH